MVLCYRLTNHVTRSRVLKKLYAIIIVFLCIFSASGCTPISENKTYDVNDYRTTMQFYDDFKILQLTDLHLGIESDLKKQLGIVSDVISKEAPDLIILTGDNFMYATKEIVYNLIKMLNDECEKLTSLRSGRLTKFAITYGNHDNQGDYPRYYANSVIKTFTTEDGREIIDGKYGAFRDYEDDNIFGLTNYFIDLVDDRQKDTNIVDVKYRLHIIDSNTYHFTGIKYEYDYIHEDQLAHANKIYQTATVDKDYIGICFFHIPFVEFEDVKTQYESAENPESIGQGKFGEDVLCPFENNGSYTQLKNANIISFIVGHNHVNYGDFIYNAQSSDINDKALFSYGVKATNQLYHDEDMLGYKTITLEDNMTIEKFLNMENVSENFINNTAGMSYYE